MAQLISPSQFEKHIMNHYKFLVDDFGFTLSKIGDWSFRLETENARVSILAEHQTFLSVALEPIGKSARQLLQKNVIPKGISVIVISMCLDPSLNYRIARLDRDSVSIDIPNELKRQAQLIKRYCSNMLRDDFSDWLSIEDCMSRRANEFLNI